jgi:glucarate dehydratase
VNIPLETPYFWPTGICQGTSRTVVEVETDDGVVGLGESPSADCAEQIAQVLAPRLIGFDLLDLAACEQVSVPETRMVQNTDDNSIVKSFGGVEMALWDLRGKYWRQPLYQLLGGASDIPFSTHVPDLRRALRLGVPDTFVLPGLPAAKS